jgi:hypothetical protein
MTDNSILIDTNTNAVNVKIWMAFLLQHDKLS